MSLFLVLFLHFSWCVFSFPCLPFSSSLGRSQGLSISDLLVHSLTESWHCQAPTARESPGVEPDPYLICVFAVTPPSASFISDPTAPFCFLHAFLSPHLHLSPLPSSSAPGPAGPFCLDPLEVCEQVNIPMSPAVIAYAVEQTGVLTRRVHTPCSMHAYRQSTHAVPVPTSQVRPGTLVHTERPRDRQPAVLRGRWTHGKHAE